MSQQKREYHCVSTVWKSGILLNILPCIGPPAQWRIIWFKLSVDWSDLIDRARVRPQWPRTQRATSVTAFRSWIPLPGWATSGNLLAHWSLSFSIFTIGINHPYLINVLGELNIIVYIKSLTHNTYSTNVNFFSFPVNPPASESSFPGHLVGLVS